MEIKFNVSELRSIKVNSYLFFSYLAMELNEANEFNVGDFYNLLTHIKNRKFKNILAEFKYGEEPSDIINLCYKYYNGTDITIINDCNKMLIKLNTFNCVINLIINNFNKDYNIFKFINDYLDYEAEVLNNE